MTFLLICVTFVPTRVFWTMTPALLVRDGAQGVRFLAKAGLAGLVIQGIVLSFAQRLVFPSMLAGWTGFGPIGVAMAIMTWCGVIGIGWVATACVGAVLWERSATPETVIAAPTDIETSTEVGPEEPIALAIRGPRGQRVSPPDAPLCQGQLGLRLGLARTEPRPMA